MKMRSRGASVKLAEILACFDSLPRINEHLPDYAPIGDDENGPPV